MGRLNQMTMPPKDRSSGETVNWLSTLVVQFSSEEVHERFFEEVTARAPRLASQPTN